MRDRMGKDLLKNVILSFFLRWRHIAKMLSRVGKIGFLVALLCVITMAVSWNFSLYFLTPLESSLCACNKCLTEDDPWFRELIEKSPKPFMSRMQGTPEEAFNWWKRLQLERGNFNFYSATVSKLLELFPSSPNVVEVQSGRCQSCAVVGNSGNLKGSRHGPLIDYHDIVIRMNHGHTKGYEEDVGTKTTHHVMYPESAVYLDNTTHLVLFPFKIKDLLWLLNTFTPGENSQKNPQQRGNQDLVMILNPAFMKYVHEVWLKNKGSYPSTGFLTLAASMHMCDKVSVFGFGADSDGNWNHYFEVLKNKNLRTGPHAGKHEYDFIQQLHQKQKIQFFKGQ